MNEKKQRLSYIDVAKGLLILSVILHHLLLCLNKSANCANNDVYRESWNVFMTFIVPFFMPCFFICSGMVSNYNKNLKNYISSSGLSLLVPATIIGRGGWFVSAMFIARIIYWWVLRTVKKLSIQFLLLIAFAISACFLFRYANILNATFILHAMGLAVYFFVGHNYSRITNIIKAIFSVSFLVLTIVYLHKGIIPPHITNSFDVSIINYPIHFIMAVGGSILFIELSKLINSNSVIEYIGRNSLVIYLTHIVLIQAIIPKVPHAYLFQDNNTFLSVIILLAAYCVMALLSVLVSAIFRTKPLKWIIGDYK